MSQMRLRHESVTMGNTWLVRRFSDSHEFFSGSKYSLDTFFIMNWKHFHNSHCVLSRLKMERRETHFLTPLYANEGYKVDY